MSFPLLEVKRKETEDYLKQLYEQGRGDKYILSFSMVNKYGININPEDKNTPLGIYGYLLKHFFEKYDGSIKELPFGTERPYILVLKIKPDAKVLLVSKITSSDVEKLFEYLYKYANNTLKEEIERVLHKNPLPPRRFFGLLSYAPNIFKATSKDREHILLRNILVNLGYDIIIDDGWGLIHWHEPYQVVILNQNKAEHVDTLYNPYAKMKPKDEENYRVAYHYAIDPIEAFIFTVLKNRLNLDDKRITDKLFFLLKKLDPSITLENYEYFLWEIKPIIKQIYDRYNEKNYNPIEAVMKYLPTFKFRLMYLSEKYHLGELSLFEIQSMMQTYLMDRDLKKYTNLFPEDIYGLFNGDLLLKDLIFHSIRYRLDKETITKLADLIYKNLEEISLEIPESIRITILKMSQNKAHRDFADSLIKKIPSFPSFFIEIIKNIVNILQSKQTPIEKIANVVDKFLKLPSYLIPEFVTKYRNKDFSDKKQILQWIVVKLKEYIDKVAGNLFSQDEKNLLIKIGAERLLHELNKYMK